LIEIFIEFSFVSLRVVVLGLNLRLTSYKQTI